MANFGAVVETGNIVAPGLTKGVLTKIAGKFQVTVPPEIRSIFDLREGDLLEWSFNREASCLVVIPKRAQLLTPQLLEGNERSRTVRAELKNPAPDLVTY